LETVHSTKMLGVIVDDKLTMSEQVQAVINKVRRGNYALRVAGPKLSLSARRLLYNGIVAPHFNYCDSLLNQASKTDQNRLQVEQNKAIRAVSLAPRMTNHHVLLSQHRWLDLAGKRRVHMATAVWKCQKGPCAPEAVSALLKPTANIHLHETRGAATGLLDLPRFKTEQGKRSFAFQAAKIWNGHVGARLARTAVECRNQVYRCELEEIDDEAVRALQRLPAG